MVSAVSAGVRGQIKDFVLIWCVRTSHCEAKQQQPTKNICIYFMISCIFIIFMFLGRWVELVPQHPNKCSGNSSENSTICLDYLLTENDESTYQMCFSLEMSMAYILDIVQLSSSQDGKTVQDNQQRDKKSFAHSIQAARWYFPKIFRKE